MHCFNAHTATYFEDDYIFITSRDMHHEKNIFCNSVVTIIFAQKDTDSDTP